MFGKKEEPLARIMSCPQGHALEHGFVVYVRKGLPDVCVNRYFVKCRMCDNMYELSQLK